jgi:hypothetical protein
LITLYGLKDEHLNTICSHIYIWFSMKKNISYIAHDALTNLGQLYMGKLVTSF